MNGDAEVQRAEAVLGPERVLIDPLGIALSCVNAAGESVQYGSNTAGQLTSASFSDGTRSDYTYDAEGHLKTATNAAGMVQFTYEPTTRLLSRVDYPNGKWLSFGYDAGGRRAQMKDQDDFTTKYTYDAVGRLETLKDGLDNVIVRYTYDHAGRLFQKTNANGTYTTYGYCSCGKLADVNNFAPGGALNSQFHYTYDSVGAMRTQTTLDGTWTYTHDANGQLTHAVFASNNAALVPNQDLIYNYDAMGNRTSTVINGVSTAYVPNNMNQYASVGGTNCNYDLKGNLLSDGINSYSYNALNRLVVTSGPSGATSYTYNALGQRVSSASGGQTTQYLIDPTGLGDVVGTFDGNGNLIAHYNYGRGLVSRVAGASSVYYDFDLLGSTTGLSGSTGSYVNKYRYDPFGNSLASTGPIANPFQFVGQLGVEYQGNGIVFMRARFYAAVQGRFTSTDPLSIGAGDTNLFRYVGNNPVAATDPLGLCDISLGLDLGGVPELVTGAGALLVVANASNPVGWVIGGVGLVWWIGGLFNLPHEIQSIMTENGWIDDWSKLHDPLRNFPQEYK